MSKTQSLPLRPVAGILLAAILAAAGFTLQAAEDSRLLGPQGAEVVLAPLTVVAPAATESVPLSGFGAGAPPPAAPASPAVPAAVSAPEVAAPAPDVGPAEPVEITSDNAEMNFAGRTAVFSGNVRVRDRDFRLQADRMTVNFSEDEQLEKIVAAGNVVINDRGGARTATGGKAEFTTADGKIVLTENPGLTDGRNMMQNAERITFYRNDNRVVFEGRPTLRIAPTEGDYNKPDLPGTGKTNP